MKGMRWLPSPAMVMALGALILSVGGNVTAAVLVTSAGIKDNTIRSVDIRDRAIQGVDVADGTLTGADVNDGAIQGADVNESTLTQVPSAASARNAENAGTVDGFDANSLTRVARVGILEQLEITHEVQTYGTPLSITAPTAGFVMIHGGITVVNSRCTSDCTIWGQIRHKESGFHSVPAINSLASGQQWDNMSFASVFKVSAGVNTFDLRLFRSGDGILSVAFGELVAAFSPFGSTGGGTLATDAATTASQSPDGG